MTHGAREPTATPRSLPYGAYRRSGLIRLTPLIDVVFILLVFFMLASSFLDWRAIELKAPAGAVERPSFAGALLVEVNAEGVQLSGRPVSLEDLAARVERRLAERPAQRVLVKPAHGVALQEAVRVIDRLSAAGVTELSFLRDPESRKADP